MPQEPAQPSEQKIESQHPVLQAAEHVLGVGLGAAGGMAVGGVLGAVGGPPGIAAGAVAGALAGGLGGEALADLLDPGFTDDCWQKTSQRHRESPASPGQE